VKEQFANTDYLEALQIGAELNPQRKRLVAEKQLRDDAGMTIRRTDNLGS